MTRWDFKLLANEKLGITPTHHPLYETARRLIVYQSTTKIMLQAAISILDYINADR